MPSSRSIECGLCSESITKSQGSIGCNICRKWFHASCAKLADKDLLALKAIKVSAFICSVCQSNLSKIRDNVGVTGVGEDIRNLSKKLDTFIENQNTEIIAMRTAIDNMKSEMTLCLTEMRTDINKYSERIDRIEMSTSTLSGETKALKAENNALHRRLNRGDFLIGGLPDGLDDLVEHVISLGAFFKIQLTRQDVNHVCYINRRKQILVKLNSVDCRDKIMKQYFKTRSLRVCDIVKGQGPDITSRVYLNDHYTPAAGYLNTVCNKLRRLNVITKFKILNGDKTCAKLMFPDGKDVIKDVDECVKLLNERN